MVPSRVILVCALLLGPSVALAEKPDSKKVLAAVKTQLNTLKAPGAVMEVLKDAAVDKTFPEHVFVTVLYPQFPVARAVPKPLKPACLYVQGGDGKLTLLADLQALNDYFGRNVKARKTDEEIKNASKAFLKLYQHFQQDGFYAFALMDGETKIEMGERGKECTVVSVVMKGGNGKMTLVVKFNPEGNYIGVSTSQLLERGPRPRCQATKLLDPDPIVRHMAEEALLSMGRQAREYLLEQRAKASPELQKAIDAIWERIQREGR